MEAYLQQFGLIAVLILFNAFFAAGEIAVISSRPIRIKQLADEGHSSAKALLKLLSDHSRFLATIQVGITLAGFLASASAAVGMSQPVAAFLQNQGLSSALAQSLALFSVTLVVSYFTLVLGELVPKRMALQSPERIALLVARPVLWVSRITGPFTAFLTWSTNMVVSALGGKVEQREQTISEEELRFYVEEHQELQIEEKRLIAGVFEFSDRLVRHIMVPRPDMDCIHQDVTVKEALAQIRLAGFWRFPVYREDYDDIVGIVTVKDLLYRISEGKSDQPISAVMRQALFVPEAKRALALLKEMQSRDEQMAIVIDEYGGVAGLVTLEDLLQEIVGEIDEEQNLVGPGHKPSELILDATETVGEVAEHLNVKLPPSQHYETLAGYFLHLLGEIPTEGTELQVQGWRLVVHRMDGLRIEKIRAIPIDPEELTSPIPSQEQG